MRFRGFIAGIGAVVLVAVALVLMGESQSSPQQRTQRATWNGAGVSNGLEGLGEAWKTIEYAAVVYNATTTTTTTTLPPAEKTAGSTSTRTSPASDTGHSSSGSSGTCAIPQYICDRESGGDPTVYNHQGSGASGKYQFMPGTWNGYGGYANAADAPEWVQDEKARELWAGGAGCSHWSAC